MSFNGWGDVYHSYDDSSNLVDHLSVYDDFELIYSLN